MIELCNITKRFGDAAVVNNVSLSIQRGEILVLLGGSGSGKTTLLKMINRLIEPSSGEVILNGTRTHSMPPHTLRRSIGYCFQRLGLFPHMTVAQNIGITPRLLGWDTDRIEQRVVELLDWVELPPKLYSERLPQELSGGQQQRVGVARALAAQPQVVLFDEPFGALDPLTRDRLQQSLQNIKKRTELTAVFVTHDIAEALMLGERIAILHQGRLLQIDVPEKLLADPAHPYVKQLLGMPAQQSKRLRELLSKVARGHLSTLAP